VSQHLQAAAAYPTTFYGQMAIARLAHAAATAGPDAGDSGAALRQALGKLANPGGTEAKLGVLDNAELIQAAKLFTAWGDTAHARQFLAHDVSLQQDGRFLGMIAATASQLGLIDVGVLAARRAGRFGVVLLDAGWPVPVGFSHEDKLALAVARQESNFDPGIVSPSGAQGLMQLMLGTAEDVRRGAGKPAASLNLFDPSVNIDIGTRYLDILLDEFGGVRPYAIAAYNAGPRHVREWLAANGDPASAPDMGAMADWVEQIPFGETRNYVERVLENLAIYNALLDKK
jgi:soluble lytic murein transglycosylase